MAASEFDESLAPFKIVSAGSRSGTFRQGDVVHERYYAGHGRGLGREQRDRCLFVALPSIALFCFVAILGGADRLDRLVSSLQLAFVRFIASKIGSDASGPEIAGAAGAGTAAGDVTESAARSVSGLRTSAREL